MYGVYCNVSTSHYCKELNNAVCMHVDDPLNAEIIILYDNETNILVYQYAVNCSDVFIYSYSMLDLA